MDDRQDTRHLWGDGGVLDISHPSLVPDRDERTAEITRGAELCRQGDGHMATEGLTPGCQVNLSQNPLC